MMGSSMGGSAGGMGMPNLTFGQKPPASAASGGSPSSGSPKSTAKRGNNWALPQAKPHETGVTRPMRVSIEPQRVVLVPERGDDRPPQVVKVAPNLSLEDVNHVVSAVQNEVKRWGLAVSNGYWKPVLQAEVAPGACIDLDIGEYRQHVQSRAQTGGRDHATLPRASDSALISPV